MKINNIGTLCKRFRQQNGYSVKQVADDTLYSIYNVYAFEQNRNNNGDILLWYVLHGFDAGDLVIDATTDPYGF